MVDKKENQSHIAEVEQEIIKMVYLGIETKEMILQFIAQHGEGMVVSEIRVVESSASIFNTKSVFIILSRRFSFFSPLYCLYSFAVLSAHVL